jgi:transcription initiation factor TFIIH subunit 2
MSPSTHWRELMASAMMDEAPLRRSIIRHMFLIIDLSDSMRDRDFRPTRYVTL